MDQVNFQEYIDKIPYDTVHQAVWGNFYDWLRVKRIEVALFFLGLATVLVLLFALNVDLRWGFAPALVYFLLFIGKLEMQGKEVFFRSVAASWGWDFFPAKMPKDFPNSFLKFGGSGVALFVIRSRSQPGIEIATLSYVLGSGNNAKLFNTTAIRVDLEFPVMGLILVDSDARLGAQLSSWYPDMGELKFEVLEEANRSVYIEKQLEIEALQVFSDDRLAKLATATAGFTVEFRGTDVFVYSSSVVKSRQDFSKLLEISQLVLDELVPKLAQISSSTRAMQEAKQDKGI